ncbi:hypothetical protein CEUSTIGMA_g13393.t1 [Chlamydomonas eustigma]|uniref:Uncharacterized protein n=1 Tax=Chlamydomonas eustigma TaxID=1157962 RepID=A0A250XSC0_9CHLO|nr:hypothetical protein CEUSTIGMA_g13393.t1 [Chlamydomonas eustigma]|eukprot:GAX85977.1 hypothetical protein CEUSTIGMA_g13393.t1 [Chlamydomonas eustigma]
MSTTWAGHVWTLLTLSNRSPLLSSRKSPTHRNAIALCTVTVLCCIFLSVCLRGLSYSSRPEYKQGSILISYAYYEKDAIQRSNFELFLKLGTDLSPTGQHIHWNFVISTETCSPCRNIFTKASAYTQGPEHLGVRKATTQGSRTLIYRTENTGMDIASHNVSFSYLQHIGRLRLFRYFIMINSSAKGPFQPAYMPPDWHWTHAYLVRFKGDIHAVASSMVCLPTEDEGGPGPRIESWAYAVDQLGLRALQESGAYNMRTCKGCKGRDSIILSGEYSIGLTMIRFGYNMATLMLKYSQDVDWRDPIHWKCNDNVHPSRHGTYDGISLNPIETVFVKSTWHVAEPYTRRYAGWLSRHRQGMSGTEGTTNQLLYKFAISEFAQGHNKLAEGYNLSSAISQWQAHEESISIKMV